jgi:hypothetical protein
MAMVAENIPQPPPVPQAQKRKAGAVEAASQPQAFRIWRQETCVQIAA